jgi:hypothetical protein
VLATGFAVFLANLAGAWLRGRTAGDDPWDGDSLEWATSSPPPPHNFAELPAVGSGSPTPARGTRLSGVRGTDACFNPVPDREGVSDVLRPLQELYYSPPDIGALRQRVIDQLGTGDFEL